MLTRAASKPILDIGKFVERFLTLKFRLDRI